MEKQKDKSSYINKYVNTSLQHVKELKYVSDSVTLNYDSFRERIPLTLMVSWVGT